MIDQFGTHITHSNLMYQFKTVIFLRCE